MIYGHHYIAYLVGFICHKSLKLDTSLVHKSSRKRYTWSDTRWRRRCCGYVRGHKRGVAWKIRELSRKSLFSLRKRCVFYFSALATVTTIPEGLGCLTWWTNPRAILHQSTEQLVEVKSSRSFWNLDVREWAKSLKKIVKDALPVLSRTSISGLSSFEKKIHFIRIRMTHRHFLQHFMVWLE